MQPVIIEDQISIAANSTNENVIVSNPSLRRYLRSPFAARGLLAAVQSAAGLTVQMDYGSKNVVASSTLRVGTDLQLPLDVLNDEWHPSEGDQLVLRVANTTGGALVIRYKIVLEPLAEPGQVIQMPPDTRTMQSGPIAIAIGAVDVQLLDGLRYERAPVDSMLSVFLTASATGLLRQLFVQSDSIAPPSAIAPLNRVPQDPFDLSIADVEAPQDQLIELSTSNPTAGILNVFWKVKLAELART